MARTVIVTLALVVSMVIFGGCDMTKTKKDVTGTVQDPLVRERVLRRIDELYGPAKVEAEKLRELRRHDECEGVCDMSHRICDVSARVCDLASDYPESDEEIHEKCAWAEADCDESRVACVSCGGGEASEDAEE